MAKINYSLVKIQRFGPKKAYGCHGNGIQGISKILSKIHIWYESQLICKILRNSEDMDLSPIFHFAWILREPVLNATVTVHQFFCILHFCQTCSLCRVELVAQFPARCSTLVLLCLFLGVLWLWHFLYSVGPYPVASLHIHPLLCRGQSWRVQLAKQETLTPPGHLSGLTSGLQGSVNVHRGARGALLLVPQWECIRSFCIFHIVSFGLKGGGGGRSPSKSTTGISWVHCTKKRILIRPLPDSWFLLRMMFPLVTVRALWNIGFNRRETSQFECFIASFNLLKVLQGSFENEYWHMLIFPTGKCRPPGEYLFFSSSSSSSAVPVECNTT